MQRSEGRILTTHVGSLPRSDQVGELLARRARAEAVDPDDLTAAVKEARRSVIRQQAEAGIDIGNDGEQGRTGYNVYVRDRMAGFGEREVTREQWADLKDFPGFADRVADRHDLDERDRPVAIEPIEYDETAATEELRGVFELVGAAGEPFEEVFMTAASPGVASLTLPNDYYDSFEDYLFSMADQLSMEYELVAEAGAVLQLDAPDLFAYRHRHFQDRTLDEFKDLARTFVAAINEATADVPNDRIRLHACWGNYEGPHHHDVDLEEMLPILYEAEVGGLMIEGANPRHQHEYRAFAEHSLPDDWLLFPGVVDVKTNILEHPGTVADRIERVADAVGDPSRIVATPDCGFGTLVGWQLIDREIAWAKLEQLVAGAAVATDRLF